MARWTTEEAAKSAPLKNREALDECIAFYPGFGYGVHAHARESGGYSRALSFTGYPFWDPNYNWAAGKEPCAKSGRHRQEFPTLDQLAKWAGEGCIPEGLICPGRLTVHEAALWEGLVKAGGGDFLSMLGNPTKTLPVVAHQIAQWYSGAASGKESTIVIPVCPDWAAVDGRYTFNGLGCGVGVVARRAMRLLPRLIEFLEKRNLRNVRIRVVIGDFEAESPANCERAGITREEFLRRTEKSLAAMQKECSDQGIGGVNFTGVLNLLNGVPWGQLLEPIQHAVASGSLFGVVGAHVTPEMLEKIVEARGSLYRRWYGTECDLRAVYASQVPEYGGLCEAVERAGFLNPLFLGVDHSAMQLACQAGARRVRPVVYLSGADY